MNMHEAANTVRQATEHRKLRRTHQGDMGQSEAPCAYRRVGGIQILSRSEDYADDLLMIKAVLLKKGRK
jgi:hypothetical protein